MANPVLSEPYEFVDLDSGVSMVLNITSYERGEALIHPTSVTPRHVRIYMMQHDLTEPPSAGTPISVQVPVLRVDGTRLDKQVPNHYWDFSSKRLQAQLIPLLAVRGGAPLVVTITANGRKPAKTYSVEVGG